MNKLEKLSSDIVTVAERERAGKHTGNETELRVCARELSTTAETLRIAAWVGLIREGGAL